MSESSNPTNPPAPADGLLVLASGGKREMRAAASVRTHDFRQSGFLAASELRRIRQRHEQFIRSVAGRLAMFLRLEFSLQLAKIQIDTYEKFTNDLTGPSHITLFKTEPLKGVGLLVISPKLACSFVDRLLGGSGVVTEANHELSEIEIALVDQVATILLSEWCQHWPELRELKPTLIGHETNSHFLQTSTPETSMLTLTMTGGIPEQSEPLQLVFPYATVEPLMRLLMPAPPQNEAGTARVARVGWKRELDEVRVPMVAEWRGLKMSAGDITRLKVGDVVALDAACAAQVQLRLGRIHKFAARPGTTGGKRAVQVTAVNVINPTIHSK